MLGRSGRAGKCKQKTLAFYRPCLMSTPAELLHQPAGQLGVFDAIDGLAEIVRLGKLRLHNACYQKGAPSCAWDSSEIHLPDPKRTERFRPAVLIDIGGTQTKVGYQNDRGEMRCLFDHPNTWFQPSHPGDDSRALEPFLDALITEIKKNVPYLAPDCCLGLIWSNQVQCVPIHTPTTRGVSGIVRGSKSGGYRKGEWFLKGIRDGDDIGALFLLALSRAGWKPAFFLLGNDTIFTLFATQRSSAGVVMSSGGNCTVIGDEGREKGHIINTELGGNLAIPENLLSDGDRFCAEMRGVSSLSLEELCAGLWFPTLVYAHVCAAAELPDGAPLAALRDALVSGEATLNNRMLVASLKNPASELVPQVIRDSGASFTSLLEALVMRGGALAGALCYLSVASQLDIPEGPATVSLDSSMSRHFPGFFASLSKTFKELCGGRVAELILAHPMPVEDGGEISVPMQGIARALNTYET